MTLEQIEKIMDSKDFWVHKYDDMFGAGEPGWEFGQMTPCGEDWIEVIEADDVDTLIEKLRQRVDNWDSEEEAKIWFESAGKNGVPGIRDLLDDADWKEETLKDLLVAIEEAPDEEDEIVEESKKVKTGVPENTIDDIANYIEGIVGYNISITPTGNGFSSYDVNFLNTDDSIMYSVMVNNDAIGDKVRLLNTLILELKRLYSGKTFADIIRDKLLDELNKIHPVSKKVTETVDEEKTKVIFRKELEDGDIIAVFPEDKQDNGMIGCYAHSGQHSTMSLDYYKETVPATPEEYKDLKAELENIVGYNLDIVTELDENKKLQEDDVDLENQEDLDKLADEIEPTAVDELIEEWKAKSPLHDRVISEIVEDSEGYNGDTLKERIQGRLGDIANGLVNGTVGSLIYYTDTVKFFDDYYDDIWDVIQDLVDNGLEPLEAIKEHCDETEILMCSDTVKNWVAWLVYEEIAFLFDNALDEIKE